MRGDSTIATARTSGAVVGFSGGEGGLGDSDTLSEGQKSR